MKKRIITILLTFVMTMGLEGLFPTISLALESTGNATFDAFINDGRYTHNAYWDNCYTYAQAFTGYCFGNSDFRTGAAFSGTSEVRAGDVIWINNSHYFVVLKRNGNSLYTAEGNFKGKNDTYPRVNIDWSYTIVGNQIKANWSTAQTFTGWHWGTPAPDTSHNPIGTFDVAEGKCGEVFVRGWAFDPDNNNQQIEVHVYIGGPAGEGEGHAIIANTERPDVNNVYGCGNYHGFNSVIPTNKTGNQTIYAYAINIGEGGNCLIGTKTINISDPNPTGTFDSAEGGCGSVTVNGWAFDPNDTSKPIDIHVYIGGPTGTSGTEGHNGIVANTKRPDVNNVYKCGDYHGFSATIPTNKTGQQTVYVYGINIGNGWVNPCIGSKTVTIKSHSLTKIPAKAATTTSNGNITYWKCKDCGKCFKDSAGKTEIKKSDTIIAKKKSAATTPKLYLSRTSYTWNNKVQTPKIAVKAGSKTLPVSCYKVTLPKGRKNVGTYTIKVTLKNGYSGTRSASYSIKPRGTGLTGVTAASKAATVKWAKQATKMSTVRITGYQIQYSLKKDFKSSNKAVNVGGYTKTSRKITGLASKKTYYFRVRTYLKSGSKTYYSGWSKARAVKVK